VIAWRCACLLTETAEPTGDLHRPASFAVNSLTALGVLRALRERAVRIPEQMSVLTFDDVPIGDLLDPPLTVIEQPTHRIGAVAAEQLLRRISGPTTQVREVLLSARLVVRGSTGSVPEGDAQSGGEALG
jgi:LacI family transcriptional regulator